VEAKMQLLNNQPTKNETVFIKAYLLATTVSMVKSGFSSKRPIIIAIMI
jgi:hypothetical protein